MTLSLVYKYLVFIAMKIIIIIITIKTIIGIPSTWSHAFMFENSLVLLVASK